ncbi:hypothetical protein [Natrialba hulunbeirensis]|nr:hypothetical protein [Natrialba hulunbeirensis]
MPESEHAGRVSSAGHAPGDRMVARIHELARIRTEGARKRTKTASSAGK